MKPDTFDRAPLVGVPALPAPTPDWAGDRTLEQLLAGSRLMHDGQGRPRNLVKQQKG